MTDGAEAILRWILSLSEWLFYPIAASAAAIENLVPPFPGDVVVVTTAVVAGARGTSPVTLFLVAWLANVASALLVYELGRRYGQDFFSGRFGRFLLAPIQLEHLESAYRKYGVPIIFFSRFLPVFRPMVPVFAGVAHLGFLVTALPILFASGIWYGILVYLGTIAGQNLPQVVETLDGISGWLWIVAIAVLAAMFWWWRRTREPVN